ncbi:matrixin family metalloprotease [Azospirillum sp. A39]|uniref:matrixin family metalloprotease n=1 Tax=Azospirillum sp. A39 TaxID=3462279 RepID=UPI00404654DD
MPMSLPGCLCPRCSGIAEAGPSAAFDASAWQAPSAYLSSSSGVSQVDALLSGDDTRWNADGPFGMPVTVTYSFMDAVPSYYAAGDIAAFEPFNAAMEEAARSALARYAAIADIVFVEVPDSGDGGQIRFGAAQLDGGTAGYAYFPSASPFGGDVWLDVDDNAAPTEGSYAYLTVLHEVGHALGLKHPGNYGPGTGDPPYLSAADDNTDQTVMSYHSGTVAYPSTLGPLDVQAIEYLYGPKTAKTIGNLQAGSDAAESLTGTSANNSLLGRGGDDVLTGGAGNDGALGGTGSDWLQGDGGSDTLYGNQDRDTLLGGDAADTLFGGQGEDWADGGAGSDVVYGNLANDLLVGGDGWDTLFGGQGDDVLYGGDAVDALFGNLGNDTLEGGAGSDYFYAGHNGGVDIVTDFERLGDWLIVPRHVNGTDIATAADVVARAHDVAGGVAIDLGGGNAVVLLGLNAATLNVWDFLVQG